MYLGIKYIKGDDKHTVVDFDYGYQVVKEKRDKMSFAKTLDQQRDYPHNLRRSTLSLRRWRGTPHSRRLPLLSQRTLAQSHQRQRHRKARVFRCGGGGIIFRRNLSN